MKKQLVLAAMAVLTLASCSKEVIVKTPGLDGGISFRPFATKATANLLSNVDSIYVQAIKKADVAVYFADAFLSDGNNPAKFESVADYYWPADNDSLYFDTYFPDVDAAGNTIAYTFTDLATRTITYTPAESIKQQQDLIVGTTGGDKTNNNDGVALTLKHALAQIKISAKKTSGNYKVEILGARLVNVKAGDKYSFKNAAWSLGSKTNYVSGDFSTALTLAKDGNSSEGILVSDGEVGTAMIVPQAPELYQPIDDATHSISANPKNTNAGAYLSLKIKVYDSKDNLIFPADGATADNDTYCAIPFPYGTEWKGGLTYHYMVDFSGNAVGLYDPAYTQNADLQGTPIMSKPIFFKEVTVTDWAADASEDIKLTDFQ